jgi:two-component system sensor histidine kinase TctE
MRRPDSFSIHRRVFGVACLLLVIATVSLVFFLRGYARSASDQAFDRLLAASALTIAGSIQLGDQGVTVEPPFSALAMMSAQERIFYTVRDAGGGLITGYGDLALREPLARAVNPVFSDERYRGDDVRIVTVGRLVSADRFAGWVTVRVAETRGARGDLAAEILNRSVVPLIAVALVALAVLWFGIGRAFAPLTSVERTLRRRAPEDLSPFAEPVPREVRGLVDALNVFMSRLAGVMHTLNNLVADAAHQVRTPLASLRAQAEVALDDPDPVRLRQRVARIHHNAEQASELINQLLMDATISHRLGVQNRSLVGVAETINATRRRVGPLLAQRLTITIAPEVRRARISGDRVALREMLRNLVDNALRYAPEGQISIQATPVSNLRVALTVSDAGPGIADDEKTAVLQRFVRGRAGAESIGSGLGLAIVSHVAGAHGGALRLSDRPGGGLIARVVLPLAQRHGERGNRAASRSALRKSAFTLLCCGLLLAGLAAPPARADTADGAPHQIETRYPAPQPAHRTLVIAGPTDTAVVSPLVRAFQEERPDIDVVYREMGAREVYEAALASRLPDVDVLMSSAADLQIRLANDGYALHYAAPGAAGLPSWAKWRDEVFGFTFEPAVWLYNLDRFNENTVPRTRQDLLALLTQQREAMRGRVGTYDIGASGTGYLLAEQDELLSSNFWGLANVFGQVHVRLSATTAGIMDAIEHGEIDLGYNVLGSYALARQAAGARIGIVFPRDYVLVLARSVLIMRGAPRPELARALVDFVLSPAGQQVASDQTGLGSIMEDTPGRFTSEQVLARSQGVVQPVALSPALIVGLDQQRRSRFVQNWTRLVSDTGQPPALPPGQ